MRHSCIPLLFAEKSAVTAVVLSALFSVALLAAPAEAAIVAGGGSPSGDCLMILDIPAANKPAPPKAPKSVDCIDGDPACDDDGTRNGECVFPLTVCANSTELAECMPGFVQNAIVDHAIDNGEDPRFDNDFLALQSRVNGLGLPDASPDSCTLESAITVKLRGPDSKNQMKSNRKTVRITSSGENNIGPVRDVDKVKFNCRPEGDAVYLPTDLYTGTFDRISKQVFAQSCAISACHDSESHEGDLILLPGAAYGNIVNVTPDDSDAATDGLDRITPGDPSLSFLYRKITDDLEADWGDPMPKDASPLSAELIELIRLWIEGDGVLGPAPETGWVEGTDD